jgi:hypothetical protein
MLGQLSKCSHFNQNNFGVLSIVYKNLELKRVVNSIVPLLELISFFFSFVAVL